MATRMYVCESAEHPPNLLLELNEQRLQGQLCDVTIRVQGHLFKAHTNILASSTGYFRDLFLNPSKQMKKEIIEIPTIVNNVGFSKVLDFIYTSQLCLSQASVMQVLCSACYLQIPYVVEKCQEFIITHGHVSTQNPFPPILADQRYLSGGKMSENQECELINTPPSPGNQSGSNGGNHLDDGLNGSPSLGNDEPHDLSPGGSMSKTDGAGVLIKQENSEPYANGERAVSESDLNPASRALMQFSNHRKLGALLRSNSPRNGPALKMLPQNGEGRDQDAEVIDHESLAEYFARNVPTTNADSSLALQVYGGSSPSTAIEQHLYSMTKSISGASQSKDSTSSPTSSVSQYLLAMKKEKPKKEYRCEYCSKLFGRQQHLKRHILTHTGERPYPCTLCEKRFRRSEHLKHHLVKHQQEANLASGGTATFVDFTTTSRKRPRKAAPMPQDAYGMSKMMLVSYKNQPTPAEQRTASDNKTPDLIGSNPILMNKLNAGSALESLSERLAFAAAQRGNSEQDKDAGQVPFSTNAAGSPIALNLSGKAALQSMVNGKDESPSAADLAPSDHAEGSPAGERPEENGLDVSTSSATNLDADHKTELNEEGAIDEMATDEGAKQFSPQTDEQKQSSANDMSMDSFAKSEVVTPDLKRLFAAMDG